MAHYCWRERERGGRSPDSRIGRGTAGLSILKEKEGRNMSANTARQKGVYIGILFFSRDKSHTSWMPLFAAPGEIKRRMVKKICNRKGKKRGEGEIYWRNLREGELISLLSFLPLSPSPAHLLFLSTLLLGFWLSKSQREGGRRTRKNREGGEYYSQRKEGRRNTGLASVRFNNQNAERFNAKIARTRKAYEKIVWFAIKKVGETRFALYFLPAAAKGLKKFLEEDERGVKIWNGEARIRGKCGPTVPRRKLFYPPLLKDRYFCQRRSEMPAIEKYTEYCAIARTTFH